MGSFFSYRELQALNPDSVEININGDSGVKQNLMLSLQNIHSETKHPRKKKNLIALTLILVED